MRKLVALLILLGIAGSAGYYVYTHGWRLPDWLSSFTNSSADALTTSKVKASLGLSKRVSPFGIQVETNAGTVILKGEVPSEDVKSLAGEIARDTEGVKEVKNEISVNPGTQPSGEVARVEDLELRAAVLEAFSRSPELGGKSIDVNVENRVVTLGGTVDTPAQKNGAEQAARAVDGVAGVSNNLAVNNPQAVTEPPASNPTSVDLDSELAKRVEFELYRTGAFDTLAMKIRASDGKVTLAGTVRSRAEQLLAERIAQSTPGVKTVVNELQLAASPARR